MTLVHLLISMGSTGLGSSQVPRKTASIPTASILTYFVPLFPIVGLVFAAMTIARQAVVWWLIVAFRPVKEEG